MGKAPAETHPSTLGELFRLCDEVDRRVATLLDHTSVHYHDVNAGRSEVFIVGDNPNRWDELDGSGQYALGQARAAVDAWVEQVELAVKVGAPERLQGVTQAERSLDQILRREQTTWWTQGAPAPTVAEVRAGALDTVEGVRQLLAQLPTANGPGGRLYVPDTNALIYAPAIETWELGPEPATLVFVPQVIRELDAKKMDRRIGEKATAVIRRLKEYGRRGDTFQGVPLVGKAKVREVAVDASVEESLGWLNPSHADDQFLANVLALRWQDLRCDVALITRDRNLQNKARMARLPHVDVEDLVPSP